MSSPQPSSDGTSPYTSLGPTGAKYLQALTKNMAAAMGNRPSDAVKLSPDAELERWMHPTSGPAQRVLAAGGPMSEAITANALWSNQLKGEQAQMTQQLQAAGQTPDQIAAALQQAHLTDDLIFAQCQSYGHVLGKVHAHDDAKREADYHATMAAKATDLLAKGGPR